MSRHQAESGEPVASRGPRTHNQQFQRARSLSARRFTDKQQQRGERQWPLATNEAGSECELGSRGRTTASAKLQPDFQLASECDETQTENEHLLGMENERAREQGKKGENEDQLSAKLSNSHPQAATDPLPAINYRDATQVAGKAGKSLSLAPDSVARGRSKSARVLDPSGSLYYHWSMVVSFAFLYNFWSLSYRFAFREIDFDTVALWFALDYLADLVYALDVAINSRTGYLEDGVLQRNTDKIGQHYRESTLFYLDCLCLLPLDVLYLSIGFNSILRCTRLVKIYKFWSYVDRTERHTNYPNVFRTFTLVHYILVIFHWNACLFHMISKNKLIDIESLYRINDNRCHDILCQYLHAFYWSTLALTCIGDLPRPRTKGEYLYVTVELFFGLFLFASVLGHVANIVTNVSAARKEFQAKLDAVKTFMRMRRVSDELQNKVIRWFDYLWISQKSSDEDCSVACLPDRLKAELAIHVHLDTLKRVDIFQNTEAGFLCELVLRLKPVLFSPGDYVCRKNEVGHEMYIVSRGILEVVTDEGRQVVATLKAGSYFGEISVLNVGLAGNKRTASVRSVGYSDLFCLNKQDLWDVLKNYPNAEARIRARAEERLNKLDIKSGAAGNNNAAGSSASAAPSGRRAKRSQRAPLGQFAQPKQQQQNCSLLPYTSQQNCCTRPHDLASHHTYRYAGGHLYANQGQFSTHSRGNHPGGGWCRHGTKLRPARVQGGGQWAALGRSVPRRNVCASMGVLDQGTAAHWPSASSASSPSTGSSLDRLEATKPAAQVEGELLPGDDRRRWRSAKLARAESADCSSLPVPTQRENQINNNAAAADCWLRHCELSSPPPPPVVANSANSSAVPAWPLRRHLKCTHQQRLWDGARVDHARISQAASAASAPRSRRSNSGWQPAEPGSAGSNGFIPRHLSSGSIESLVSRPAGEQVSSAEPPATDMAQAPDCEPALARRPRRRSQREANTRRNYQQLAHLCEQTVAPPTELANLNQGQTQATAQLCWLAQRQPGQPHLAAGPIIQLPYLASAPSAGTSSAMPVGQTAAAAHFQLLQPVLASGLQSVSMSQLSEAAAWASHLSQQAQVVGELERGGSGEGGGGGGIAGPPGAGGQEQRSSSPGHSGVASGPSEEPAASSSHLSGPSQFTGANAAASGNNVGSSPSPTDNGASRCSGASEGTRSAPASEHLAAAPGRSQRSGANSRAETQSNSGPSREA